MNRTKRRPLRDYLIGGVLLLVMAWLLYLLIGIIQKEEVARMAAKDTHRELEQLQERKTTLETNLHELGTPRGQEASYREQFGVARPGEEVIIVVPTQTEKPQAPLPWWRKLFGWFGL